MINNQVHIIIFFNNHILGCAFILKVILLISISFISTMNLMKIVFIGLKNLYRKIFKLPLLSSQKNRSETEVLSEISPIFAR